MFSKQMIRLVAFLLLFLSSSLVYAATTSPVGMLQNVANQMLSYLHQHQAELKSKPQLISDVVERVLMPHINANRMAGMVVGRQVWQSATPTQKLTFIDEFKKLIISTYANALASYNNDKVEFAPLRGKATGQTLTVNSVIVRQDGQRIAISYNLVRAEGQWQVYDFSIEGVSIVQSYQSQFADVLAQGGMNALLQKLQAYNRGQ